MTDIRLFPSLESLEEELDSSKGRLTEINLMNEVELSKELVGLESHYDKLIFATENVQMEALESLAETLASKTEVNETELALYRLEANTLFMTVGIEEQLDETVGLEGVVDSVKGAIEAIINAFKKVFGKIVEVIKKIFNAFLSLFGLAEKKNKESKENVKEIKKKIKILVKSSDSLTLLNSGVFKKAIEESNEMLMICNTLIGKSGVPIEMKDFEKYIPDSENEGVDIIGIVGLVSSSIFMMDKHKMKRDINLVETIEKTLSLVDTITLEDMSDKEKAEGINIIVKGNIALTEAYFKSCGAIKIKGHNGHCAPLAVKGKELSLMINNLNPPNVYDVLKAETDEELDKLFGGDGITQYRIVKTNYPGDYMDLSKKNINKIVVDKKIVGKLMSELEKVINEDDKLISKAKSFTNKTTDLVKHAESIINNIDKKVDKKSKDKFVKGLLKEILSLTKVLTQAVATTNRQTDKFILTSVDFFVAATSSIKKAIDHIERKEKEKPKKDDDESHLESQEKFDEAMKSDKPMKF